MNKKQFNEVFSDVDFVRELLNLETGRDVKRALSQKGIKLTDEDLDRFACILADELENRIKIKELASAEMEHITGGVKEDSEDSLLIVKQSLESNSNEKSWILNKIKESQ